MERLAIRNAAVLGYITVRETTPEERDSIRFQIPKRHLTRQAR